MTHMGCGQLGHVVGSAGNEAGREKWEGVGEIPLGLQAFCLLQETPNLCGIKGCVGVPTASWGRARKGVSETETILKITQKNLPEG